MKVSLIIPVLESYEVVRRQFLHMNRLGLPRSEFEVILVDDGSIPPIIRYAKGLVVNVAEMDVQINFRLVYVKTYDSRPWTHAKAVNIGARYAVGEYVWGFAVDHFLSRAAVDFALQFDGDKVVNPRIFAVLDKMGEVCTDEQTLEQYGWILKEKAKGKMTGSGPGIQFVRKKLWDLLGGYSDRWAVGYGQDDVDINRRYGVLCRQGYCEPHEVGPPLYVFPAAAGDVQSIFHPLRKRYGCEKYNADGPAPQQEPSVMVIK